MYPARVSAADIFKFRFWDAGDAIESLIERWVPGPGCEAEKDYEASLYAFLNTELGELQVTRRYSRGRSEADIVVADKVIIELKTDLDSTSEFQRLVGQLTEYQDWNMAVIVVLTGQTDANLGKELRARMKKLEGMKYFLMTMNETLFRVVEKN